MNNISIHGPCSIEAVLLLLQELCLRICLKPLIYGILLTISYLHSCYHKYRYHVRWDVHVKQAPLQRHRNMSIFISLHITCIDTHYITYLCIYVNIDLYANKGTTLLTIEQRFTQDVVEGLEFPKLLRSCFRSSLSRLMYLGTVFFFFFGEGLCLYAWEWASSSLITALTF